MKALAAVLAGVVAALSAPRATETGGGDAFDFAHDVLPYLQRGGCASAYCHGSASGQGGFRLSLFGGDPLADYGALVTELGGRRIDLARPEHSLVVRKALGRLDHGGGVRLERDGAAHRALLGWLAAGAPWRRGPERALAGLELRRDGARVQAIASLGAERVDVTDRASFTSTDPLVVDLDADGALRATGPGRAFVVARFCNATATLPVVQPFAAGSGAARADRAADHRLDHTLDHAWRAHLDELGLEPAPAVAPQRLARRLWLDLVGRPPSPAELERFVAAPDVAAAVRALTARREFAATWGELLAQWLDVPASQPQQRRALVEALARGDGLVRIVERIASGDLPVLQRHADPRDRAEHASRVLLGVRVGCARCHDHPGDRWTQRDHLAFSAAFTPARHASGGGSGMVPAMAPGGLFDERTGEPVAPRWLPLSGSTVDANAPLGAFVLDAGHGQLARHFANRVFAAVIGRGLVEPVDDHRPGNPPVHEGMLEALADAFSRTGGDLRELLLLLATSRLYALDSAPADEPRARWLAAQPVRALSQATFARAVGAVLGRDAAGTLPAAPLPRELALRNGPFVHTVLAAGGTTVDAAFELGGSAPARLDDLWRSALSRPPRQDEVDAFGACAAGDLAAFRDLAAAVLLGREFGQRR